ncbi:MAG: class I SAM-dependent methyltransferase [Chloroflexi bacterium]|nr:class I SAM-dependent methyltransferase [Chloroflexota bacterium]
MAHDYTPITEIPGIGADREELARLAHRYQVASPYCTGKRVLEVACGAGMGLGLLAGTASLVVGGDVTRNLLAVAQGHYGGRVPLLQLDAHALPFRTGSFDTVVLFEALYYLARPGDFIEECRRVLSTDGTLIIGTVNREWAAFNPSPLSIRYHTGGELVELCTEHGFETELFAAFPSGGSSRLGAVVSLIKRAAVSLHLIPKSMRAKQILRRFFFGALSPVPNELEPQPSGDAPLTPVAPQRPITEFKILYAIARKT